MNEFKSALDCVRAEDGLKSRTTRFLYGEMRKQCRPRPRAVFRKYAAALAAVILIFVSGAAAYNIYTTPAAYVDVDVNPSVELVLNRFDRVVGIHAYNEDGSDIISGLPVKHKSYGDALVILMDAIAGHGYLQNGELVSVTLQTDNKAREDELLDSLQAGIAEYMAEIRHTAQLDVFPVSGDVRNHSCEQGLSPAKYLAIQELIEVDPTASVENCRRHSISEIKELTLAHASHHHDDDRADDTGGEYGQDVQESEQTGEGHEENEVTPTRTHHGGRHHGGRHG